MDAKTALRINREAARLARVLVRSKRIEKSRARAYVRHSEQLDSKGCSGK